MKVNYYRPDSLWKNFGVNNEEHYIDQFVVKGVFHTKVSIDVIKSYELVEHALALSYYHYPLFDLAIDKLLRIFEMAVNLRCDELVIEKIRVDKKGRKQKKTLNQLIDDLISVGLIDNFKTIFHNTRRIRNLASHPERYTLMGAFASQIIYPLLNLINLIFIGKDVHIENHAHFEKTKSQIVNIRLYLFILEHENQSILAYDIDMHDCYKQEDDWVYIFSFMPVVLNPEKAVLNKKSPERIIKFLRNPVVNEFSLTGFDMTSGKKIEIEKTEEPENLYKFQSQLKAVQEADKTDAYIFMNGSKLNVDRKSQQFIYENRWENNTLVRTTKTN